MFRSPGRQANHSCPADSTQCHSYARQFAAVEQSCADCSQSEIWSALVNLQIVGWTLLHGWIVCQHVLVLIVCQHVLVLHFFEWVPGHRSLRPARIALDANANTIEDLYCMQEQVDDDKLGTRLAWTSQLQPDLSSPHCIARRELRRQAVKNVSTAYISRKTHVFWPWQLIFRATEELDERTALAWFEFTLPILMCTCTVPT